MIQEANARTLVTCAGGKARDIVSFGDTSFFVLEDLEEIRIIVVKP